VNVSDEDADVKTVEKADEASESQTTASSDAYVLPIVGVHVPAAFVNVGFWGGLVGAAALGVIDPPLALFVGAGVVIARHQTKK
jgi:hypothetical protein